MFLRCFFCFCFLIFLGSCSKKDVSVSNIFRYNESSVINSLDPVYAKDQASIWAVSQIFNGLVQFDDNLKIKPSVAKKWILDSAGTKYTFFLRNDVFFHKNECFFNKTRAVSALDFVYSFNRILDPDVVSPGSWVWNYIKSVDAVNDSVLSIELKDVFSPFLGLLTMPYFFVVPEEAVLNGDFDRNPVGTGPFMYKIWTENVRMVFVKNENYFEKYDDNSLPYLDGVAVSFIKDKHIAFLEFLKGNLDFLSGLDPKYKTEILDSADNIRGEYVDKIRFLSKPYLNTEYLGFYMTGSDKIVPKSMRKAINYAINKKDMVKYLRKNIGIPGVYGIIPPSLADNHLLSKGYEYNIDSVNKYLGVFNLKNKNNTYSVTLYTNSSYLDYCEFVQSECEKVGVKINIEVMPPSVLRQSISSGKTPFFRASWIADYPNPENYFALFYSQNFSPGGPNYTHFSIPEYDSLYIRSLSSNSDSIRFLIYSKMDSILFEECPFIVLFYDQIMVFVSQEIEDFVLNPMNFLSLKKVKKSIN